MIFHPPALYLGFIAFIIPFAFALASLITRQHKDDWSHATRGWTLFGWVLLSIGLILGSRWAYDVLGWGGYWGWDPVEVAALLPWLSSTAFLHAIIAQEKRGLFRRWNIFLIVANFYSGHSWHLPYPFRHAHLSSCVCRKCNGTLFLWIPGAVDSGDNWCTALALV